MDLVTATEAKANERLDPQLSDLVGPVTTGAVIRAESVDSNETIGRIVVVVGVIVGQSTPAMLARLSHYRFRRSVLKDSTDHLRTSPPISD